MKLPQAQLSELSDFLSSYRVAKGISQIRIARILNLTSCQYVSNFERGLCMPSFELIRAYISTCKIPKHLAFSILRRLYTQAIKEALK